MEIWVFFVPFLLWTGDVGGGGGCGVAVAVADGRGGWHYGFFLVLDILFYCSGYNILL